MCISNKKDPVEWALLMYELDEVHEHLGNLINELNKAEKIDEIEFKIKMSHIYSHLNRTWHMRNHRGDMSEEQFNQYSQFSDDMDALS